MTGSSELPGGNPASPFMDEGFARAFLQRNLPGVASSRVRITRCEVLPIKYSSDRSKAVLMFQLWLTGRNGVRKRRSIVGRFTREYRSDGKSFDLMQKLRQEGFGDRSTLRVCEPLAYVPRWSLMFTSKASGIDLETMSASASEILPSASIQAARWIAKLHHTQVEDGPSRPVEVEELKVKEKLSEVAADLGSNHPSLRMRARGVERRILEDAKVRDTTSHTLVHGDYLPKNIFFDGSAMTAIDLDGCRLFDPAKDLGKFLGRQTLNVTLRGLPLNASSLREDFLSNYADEVPEDLLKRVAAYESLSYLKQAKREAEVAAAEYWLERAEERLGEYE